MTIHRIPAKAKADVAFAGVELKDATPLLASIFGGLFFGTFYGWPGYVGVPVLGYAINKLYLEWKTGRLPGHLKVVLYKKGWSSYSPAFDKQEKLFIGNSVIINPNSKEIINLQSKLAIGEKE